MIKQLVHNDKEVLIYEVMKKIDIAAELEWIEQINKYIKQEQKVRILIILGTDAAWSFRAGVEDIKWLFAHLKYIEKIAIVAESRWWKWYVKVDVFAKIFGTEERYFKVHETSNALDWLSN